MVYSEAYSDVGARSIFKRNSEKADNFGWFYSQNLIVLNL